MWNLGQIHCVPQGPQIEAFCEGRARGFVSGSSQDWDKGILRQRASSQNEGQGVRVYTTVTAK